MKKRGNQKCFQNVYVLPLNKDPKYKLDMNSKGWIEKKKWNFENYQSYKIEGEVQ